jgi:hypothetical protein
MVKDSTTDAARTRQLRPSGCCAKIENRFPQSASALAAEGFQVIVVFCVHLRDLRDQRVPLGYSMELVFA